MPGTLRKGDQLILHVSTVEFFMEEETLELGLEECICGMNKQEEHIHK